MYYNNDVWENRTNNKKHKKSIWNLWNLYNKKYQQRKKKKFVIYSHPFLLPQTKLWTENRNIKRIIINNQSPPTRFSISQFLFFFTHSHFPTLIFSHLFTFYHFHYAFFYSICCWNNKLESIFRIFHPTENKKIFSHFQFGNSKKYLRFTNFNFDFQLFSKYEQNGKWGFSSYWNSFAF
jgi:hypothetical protein